MKNIKYYFYKFFANRNKAGIKEAQKELEYESESLKKNQENMKKYE
jgi:hypothetical protein